MPEVNDTLVRRVQGAAALESLLQLIAPDDRKPRIIVDTPAAGAAEPFYTVIWRFAKVDPDAPAPAPGP